MQNNGGKAMKSQPLISIIIPIYNAEKYLRSCIDSVLAQTYTNIEVILVNDGSKDTSGEICEKYRLLDTRIKVIQLENGGVSKARNTGIKASRGDFLCFIDSDDTIAPDYISDFTKTLEEGVMIYVQGTRIIRKDNSIDLIFYKQNGTQGIDEIFGTNKLCSHGYAACKLYNALLIKDNQIEFPQDIKFSEDLLFVLKSLLYTNRIKYIKKAGYNYFLREGNASSKKYSLETELKCWKTYLASIHSLSEKHHSNLIKNADVAEIYAMLFARVRNTLYNSTTKRTTRLRIYRELTKAEKNILYNYRYISNKAVQTGYILLKFNLPTITDIYFSIIYKLKNL